MPVPALGNCCGRLRVGDLRNIRQRCTIHSMAMTRRISAKLDAESTAALNDIMKRTGWNKSQAVREAIWRAAEAQGLAKQVATNRLNKAKAKG